MRTAIYVDGFNLYHAIKNTSYKWLNLVELARQVLPPQYEVTKLRYFTAKAKGKFDRNAPKRQWVYINALKTLPEVEVHFGRFKPDTKRGQLRNLPVAGRQIKVGQLLVKLPEGDHLVSGEQKLVLPVRTKLKKSSDSVENGVFAEVQTMVEKSSDVNLAAHLLNDAWNGVFEVAAVISNDTDFVTPIDMVKGQGKKIFIVCPPTYTIAPELRDAASGVYPIFNRHLCGAQFPEFLTDRISKPQGW